MFLLAVTLLSAQVPDSTLVREFTALLQASPIENVGSHTAAVRVTGVTLGDINHDGRDEALVWINPEFRQTPTVLVYTRDASGSWTRLQEGLAPGRLRSPSGARRDTHGLRVGVDFVAGDGSSAANQRVMSVGASSGMSLVAYSGFLHGDTRTNATFVVDLSTWPLPAGTGKTCETFEFSAVERVLFAPVEPGGPKFLLALTEDDITYYQVDSVTPGGRLVMQSWIRARPPKATDIEVSERGVAVLVSGRSRSTIPRP